jgi:hypothetical protein
MTRNRISVVSALLVAGVIGMGGAGALAADSSDSALATQASTMNTLTATRGDGAVSGKISADYATFAGSPANADALVTGLRSGTAITLTSTDAKGVVTSTTFTPPTGKMGYGNVYTSLALAKQQLAGLGITNPTAQQIEAALAGGTVTSSSGQTTQLTGILQLRSQGMGWGQIANSLGYKLGPVISGMRSANAHVAKAPVITGGTTATRGAGTTPAPKSGIVTGAGSATAGSSAGASGHGSTYGRGIVTGAGTPAGVGAGQGNAYGKGIVSGASGAGGQGAAGAGGQGKGGGKGN